MVVVATICWGYIVYSTCCFSSFLSHPTLCRYKHMFRGLTMKTGFNWRRRSYLLLLLLVFSLQGCLGLGGNASNGNFNRTSTGNGQQLGVNNQAVFQGKLYFTINR